MWHGRSPGDDIPSSVIIISTLAFDWCMVRVLKYSRPAFAPPPSRRTRQKQNCDVLDLRLPDAVRLLYDVLLMTD